MLSETGHVIHEASAYAAYLKKKAGNISESTIPSTEELMSAVYCMLMTGLCTNNQPLICDAH